jgi:two-component system NtrC family sensor kinase
LSELAAGISHEINNPLCAILGRSQLLLDVLKKTSCDQRIENGLQVIESEGKRIARIVENLDLFCRASESGLQMLDVNRIIENTLSLIEAESETLHIKVQKEFDSVLPTVRGNESRLMRLFMSLMRNARAAMPDGGVMSIHTSFDRDDGSVCVVVEDTGGGIPEENLRKIFDPFFTTRDPGKGIGLGLSIAYQIVKEHGGDISIESQEGEGTRVSIMLPTEESKAVVQAGQSIKKEEEK